MSKKFKSIDNLIDISILELPDNSNELHNAELHIDSIKTKLDDVFNNNSINDYTHDYYYNEIVKILDYVGQLSVPAFNTFNQLEIMYTLKFPHSPALAKKLWLDHYDSIHYNYSILKNRCHRLLDDIDNNYITKFKIYPPNWNL